VFCALILASTAAHAHAGDDGHAHEPIRVFVMAPQVASGLAVSDAVIEGVLVSRVARLEKLKQFSFISRSEANEVMRQVGLRQLTGDDSDDAALKAVGDALRADRVVSTVVGTAGGSQVVTVTLTNVAESRAEKRITRVARGDAQFVITAANEAADELLAHLIKTYTDLPQQAAARRAPVAPAPVSVSQPVGKYAGFALIGGGLGVGGLGTVFVMGDRVPPGAVAPLFGTAATLVALGVVAIIVSPDPEVRAGSGGDAPTFIPDVSIADGAARVGVVGSF